MIGELIKKTLKIPVIEEPDTGVIPSATYSEYMHEPGLAGDGTETEGISYYQVDLWYETRREASEAARSLKKAIEHEEGCSIATIEKSCDANTKIWRAIIKFERMEE